MIVVEVKLVSARGREHDKLPGTAVIANVGTTEDGRLGDYNVRVGRLVLKALAQAFPDQRVGLPDEDSSKQDSEFNDGRT